MKKDLLGGQALIEGVMMKGPDKIGTAVYTPAGILVVLSKPFAALSKKYPILGLPFVRGIVNLFEMLALGYSSLLYSAKVAMPEEAEESTFGSIAIALVFAIGLFIVLPAFGFTLLKNHIENIFLLNFTEGFLRISIFLLFLVLAGMDKEMRRVFGYHGAEHMTVHAYEAGDKLTSENVSKYSALHPRCGTSFVLIVFIISIVVFAFLGRPDLGQRIIYKIILMPLIVGVSYEFIRLVCRLPKPIMYALLGPGLLLQKMTTRKPDAKMLDAAIAALKQAGKGV